MKNRFSALQTFDDELGFDTEPVQPAMDAGLFNADYLRIGLRIPNV